MKRMVFPLIGLLIFLGSLTAPISAQTSPATPQEPAPTSQQVGIQEAVDLAISRVFPALVQIQVVTVQAMGGRLMKFQGSGSGVIISRQGHVITNHHVAGKAKHLVCRMPDGSEIRLTDVEAGQQLEVEPDDAR